MCTGACLAWRAACGGASCAGMRMAHFLKRAQGREGGRVVCRVFEPARMASLKSGIYEADRVPRGGREKKRKKVKVSIDPRRTRANARPQASLAVSRARASHRVSAWTCLRLHRATRAPSISARLLWMVQRSNVNGTGFQGWGSETGFCACCDSIMILSFNLNCPATLMRSGEWGVLSAEC